MRPDVKPYRLHFGAVIICTLLLLTLLLAGCAATSTTVLDEEVVTNQKPMATYKSLIIEDFMLDRELITNSPEESMSVRERRYSQIPQILAVDIERYVNSRHTYNNVSRGGKPSSTTLVLKGKFTRIGRFRISIVASLHDGFSGNEVAYFRQTLWDVIDTTEAVNLLGRDIADFIDRIQYK
jgi:hypothetical protein